MHVHVCIGYSIAASATRNMQPQRDMYVYVQVDVLYCCTVHGTNTCIFIAVQLPMSAYSVVFLKLWIYMYMYMYVHNYVL